MNSDFRRFVAQWTHFQELTSLEWEFRFTGVFEESEPWGRLSCAGWEQEFLPSNSYETVYYRHGSSYKLEAVMESFRSASDIDPLISIMDEEPLEQFLAVAGELTAFQLHSSAREPEKVARREAIVNFWERGQTWSPWRATAYTFMEEPSLKQNAHSVGLLIMVIAFLAAFAVGKALPEQWALLNSLVIFAGLGCTYLTSRWFAKKTRAELRAKLFPWWSEK